jgi:hypothetical protein
VIGWTNSPLAVLSWLNMEYILPCVVEDTYSKNRRSNAAIDEAHPSDEP